VIGRDGKVWARAVGSPMLAAKVETNRDRRVIKDIVILPVCIPASKDDPDAGVNPNEIW
jgi:hypothetical protein